MELLNLERVTSEVKAALAEDIASGDLTAGLIPAAQSLQAQIIAKEPCVLCGKAWVEASFKALSLDVQLTWQAQEGARLKAGDIVVKITGPAQALLSAERVALNFLQLLSAVATQTARYVEEVVGTKAQIVDTRKTIPGLRFSQKYAVAVGGGVNHRMGLFDAVLIKENHIAALGGVTQALRAAQVHTEKAAFIQIEVETLDQLKEALDAGAQMILLDNMPLDMIRAAVQLNQGRAILEVSGGVQLDTVRVLAETGINRISIGALTKDITAIDFSMRFL